MRVKLHALQLGEMLARRILFHINQLPQKVGLQARSACRFGESLLLIAGLSGRPDVCPGRFSLQHTYFGHFAGLCFHN